MIDGLLRGIVARVWRWRIGRRERQQAQWTAEFMAGKRERPDRCMYCAYTHWANREQCVKMALEPHDCVQGNSPPQPLPRARVRS